MTHHGDRWYRRMLRALFPAEFRSDFGESMAADFADEAREARVRGARAVLGLWLRTLGGFLRVGPREHLRRVTIDARHGLRLARRRPGPTLAAAVVLALGIGAVAATFTVVDAFLLRPMPFADADRLVHVWTLDRTGDGVWMRSSWPDVQAWARSRALQAIAAFNYTEEELRLAGSRADRVDAARVSANLFAVLGVRPASGRLFRDGEDVAGAAPVVIVSNGFARRRFGNPAAAVGRTIRIAGSPHEIVGVLTPDFVFPLPVTAIWIPYSFDARSFTRQRQSLQVVARLAPGVTPGAAAAELSGIAAAESQAHGDRTDRGAVVEPLRDALNFADEIFRIGGPVLLVASLLVLLVGCANVASVLLGEALSRSRETAVRAALGGSRLRLIRQFTFEQAPLLLAAATLGLLLASAILAAVRRMIPADLYRVGDLALDPRSALIGAGAAAAAVVVAALVPAVRLGRRDLAAVLRTTGPAPHAPRTHRLQRALISLQISASVALVAATFSVLGALDDLASRDPGFARTDALTAKFILGPERYRTPEAIAGFHAELIARLRGMPGVTAAATVNHLPLNHETALRSYRRADDDARPDTRRPTAIELVVSPGYFDALGIALEDGRGFDLHDGRDARPAVVINRALASRLWPGRSPLGRQLELGEAGAVVEVVGVASNARHRGLVGDDEPIVYRPLAQVTPRHARVVIRAAGDAATMASAVQEAAAAIDVDLPLAEIRTLDQVVAEFLLPQRAMSVSIAALGAAALTVAATGLYGLLALVTAHRRHEIGIRVALGASPARVVRTIAGRTLATMAMGAAAGVGLSAVLARGLVALLPGAAPVNPGPLLLTALVIATASAAAAFVPLRRASRVDPLTVLRTP